MDSQNNSISNAMWHAKCPRCHSGDMFPYKWWQITKFVKIHQECPECGLRFDREPGFFIGAMYVSYAMIVAMVLTTWFILYFIFGDPAFEVYLGVIIFLNIVLLPIFFRYSRVIFLYAFGGVKFEKHLKKQNQK